MRKECERHYTPARDSLYRSTTRYYNDSCPYCEIGRLTTQLAERDAEIAKLFLKWQTIDAGNLEQIKHLKDQRSMLIEENTTLRTKLAECEKEVERLKLAAFSNKTYTCNYCGNEQCIVAPHSYSDIRKQVARECIDLCCKIMKKVRFQCPECEQTKLLADKWDEIRFRASCAALQGLLASPKYIRGVSGEIDFAKAAVAFGDALINRLIIDKEVEK